MKKLLFTLLAGLLITSCSDDSTLFETMIGDEVIVVDNNKLNGENPNPHLIGKAVTKPYKMKGSGELEYNDPENECGEGYDYVEVMGTGTATHLGKFSLYLDYCRAVDEDYEDTVPAGFHIAANGDLLFTEMGPKDENTPVEGYDEGGFFIYFIYTGGTGRFEEAEGWVKLYFEFDDNERPTIYSNHGEGELTY
ncbi:MAG: hypothetical protein HKN68_14930 [Saprospiraceae bacterium]|nr:hypothetical protein [Saprospiraceae bacterium]